MKMPPRPRRTAATLLLAAIPLVAAFAANPAPPATARAAPIFPLLVPSGSYLLTCTRCQFESRTTYSCKCRQRAGVNTTAQIDLSTCGMITDFYFLDNNDGVLTCRKV